VNFNLTDEQTLFQQTFPRFTEEVVATVLEKRGIIGN